MQKLRFQPFLILIIGVLLVLTGCNNKEETKEEKAKSKETLTLAWPRDIGKMNPHVYNPSQLFAQSMIFEPLVSYDKGGKLTPHLAESWQVSEDGKQYTFNLRKNVKFSDGSDFNAKVVKKNFDAILKNKETHGWLGLISRIANTEAIGDHQFKLTLTEAYYPTLQDLAVVRPVRFLAESGFPKDGDTSKGVEKSVGTGPWILDDYKADEYATFKRNDNYWGEKPTVKEIKVKVIPDAETRVLAFEKGDIDLIYGEGALSADSFNQLKSNDQYQSSLSEPVATRQLVMNTTNDILKDEAVRHALQYGFNKDVLVKEVTSGIEEKADYILPTNLPYTSDLKVTPINYDTKKAEQLLDKAGWKLPEGKTIREKDGKPLTVSIMYNSAEAIQKKMAETLQSEWAGLGVDLKLEGVELTTQVERFKANQFDLNFFSNYGAPYDPHAFANVIATKGFGFSEAISAYPNKDELIKDVETVLQSTDENERKETYNHLLSSLQEQGAIVPISYLKQSAVYQKDVTNFNFSANRDEHPFEGIQKK
ncbi:nickel ABC transporter substrate-binding protein [Macrococcus hajekii]